MQNFNVVMATDEATVVAEYSPEKQNRIQYQSEAELEDAMIKQLQAQGYKYLELHTPQEMVDNLRICMQELNGYTFADSEWDRFFKTVIANKPADVDALLACKFEGEGAGTVSDALAEKTGTIGEKLSIRRFSVIEGAVSTYIHGLGATGVVVSFDTDVADKAEFAECAKNVALQTAAMPVQYLDKDAVPAEVLAEEKSILIKQMQQDPKMANKPQQVLEKIVEGKLGKFFENNCLLHQLYVKDDSMTVAKYVESVAKSLGGSIKVTGYVRYDKGEGLEKREEDFAAEIQKMVQG